MEKEKSFIMFYRIQRECYKLFNLLSDSLIKAIEHKEYFNFLFLVYAMLSEAVKFLEEAKK